MFYVANGHNSIGRFYESFGGRGADTGIRSVGDATRAWYRPNPPLARVKWSLRNNVNLQQSGLLLAMEFVAANRERFLRNFYLKSKRAIGKAAAEGPAAWVIPADDPRPGACAGVVELLRMQGVEVHRAEREFEVTGTPASAATGDEPKKETGGTAAPEAAGDTAPSPAKPTSRRFPAGSYVIRMDQPYSRMADMLLDRQYYNVNDPQPYDDTGWSIGPLRNVRTVRVTDLGVLKVPMALVEGPARPKGELIADGSPAAYLINHNADSALMPLRYHLKDVAIETAEEAFRSGDRRFNAGTFLIRTQGAPADLRDRLAKAIAELGLTAVGVDELPKVATHPLAVPRIAILHTWEDTQDEGWFRMAFDQLGVPYGYISVHTIRDTPDLREKFDVIIFPPAGGSAQSIVRGRAMRGEPIPWKGSDLTPNMALSPDTTGDIRGGMGLEGILHLQRFLQEGGLFIPIAGSASLPIDFALTEGISIRSAPQLKAHGSVYNARLADPKSPVGYGYEENLAVYFDEAPIFQVSALGGFGGAGGDAEITGPNRPTGRGSPGDPDVPQGRPYVAPPPRPEVKPGEEPPIPEDLRELLRDRIPPPEMRPRVVLRFAPEKELLVSGMLGGGSELANRPAVIDVPAGKGHVLFFANNPMWRLETQGSYFLLFNAALNFDHLNAGRTATVDERKNE